MTSWHSSPTAYPATDLAQPSEYYVSAVRYYLLCHGGPSHITWHDRVTAALKGAERQQWQHRQQAAPTQCQRQAITQSDLQQLFIVIQRSHYCESDRCMLWAAFMTAFAGLLRVSEDTAASPRSASNGRTLTLCEVSITGTQICIRLGIPKTSQSGSGGQVILQPWPGSQLCPVQAMRKYLAICHATQTMSPLFIFRCGQYLTAKDVNYWMTRALGPGVSSHSLRIGGATAMAGRNASAWQLQKAGRWLVTRTKRTSMGRLACLLANNEPAMLPCVHAHAAGHCVCINPAQNTLSTLHPLM